MDTLAALALGTETPTVDLLERVPYGLNEPLINHVMKRNIFFHGLWQLGLLLSMLYAGIFLKNKFTHQFILNLF
jgi:Cation transporting ATPase, C-terminus